MVVEGPTHAAGFPLQTVPPRDYWKRFDDMPPAPDAPVFGAAAFERAVADGEEVHAEPYRVLIVEDDPSQLLFAESVLRSAGMHTLAVPDALAALDQLDRFEPELILMDLHMPDCDGIDLTVLIRQRRRFASTPIVFLSVEQDPERQADALRAGGSAFLAKPVRPRDLVSELEAHVQRVRELAPRHRAAPLATPAEPAPQERLMQRVGECLAMDDAVTRPGGLMVFAVDRETARQVALLAEIGSFLVACAGPRHIVANEAGGRFLLFNPDCETNLLEAYALSLRDRIAAEPFPALGPGRRVVCDVGICPFVAGAHQADTMRDAAQGAIDSARVAGRSGVFIVRDIEAAADAELVERIRFALVGAGFELLFQPIVSLRGEEREQFQALLRLHGEHRLHTAAEVVPAATRAGLIDAVDRWTLKSCVDLIVEREYNGHALRLFVNQSLDSIRDADGPAWLAALLRESRIAADLLSLELRAADVNEAGAEAARYIARIRELGVSVTLSGLEPGAAGEALLRALPVDFVKVAPGCLRLQDAAARSSWWAVFILAMVAVAREGSETVMFLFGTLAAAQHVFLAGTIVAAAIGFALALATYYALQLGSKVMSWRAFFGVTEVMLLLLAASLLITGVENLGDLGLLPTLSGRLWDSSAILPDSGPFGGLLAALTGYRARPNLMDVLVYALYWGTIFWTLFWSRPKISMARS